MILFLVGILEMIIITVWTKTVTETKVIASGIVTFINILIWYYVLERIVSDITNISLVLFYALGCAIGTVVSTYVYRLYEQSRSRLSVPDHNVPENI